MDPKGAVTCSSMIEKYGVKKAKTFSSLKLNLEYTFCDESIYAFNENFGLHY